MYTKSIFRECFKCKKKFKIFQAWIRKARKWGGKRLFCSRNCYSNNSRIKNKCKNCKKTFLTIKAVPRKYCNFTCYSQLRGKTMSYGGLHNWVKRQRGKANECKHCRIKDAKIYEWANISKKYKKELSDWISLCKSCHVKYDK